MPGTNAINDGYAGGPGALSDAQLFPGFTQQFVTTTGATINTLVGGDDPPLLLIHGHPETHVCWRNVAAKLAERFTVVVTDLRGYGDSSKPDEGADHVNYSKRSMGLDQVEDYRASVTIDVDHLKADDGRKVSQPLQTLWGAKGTVGALFDVLGLWKLEAADVQGEALSCGHLIPEEAPDALLAALQPFLVDK